MLNGDRTGNSSVPRGVGRRVGHVGDLHTHEVAGQKLTTEKPPATPHFDQAHVDYLVKVFSIGRPYEGDLTNPHSIVAWTMLDRGNRDVVNHIQSLIDQQKSGA